MNDKSFFHVTSGERKRVAVECTVAKDISG